MGRDSHREEARKFTRTTMTATTRTVKIALAFQRQKCSWTGRFSLSHMFLT